MPTRASGLGTRDLGLGTWDSGLCRHPARVLPFGPQLHAAPSNAEQGAAGARVAHDEQMRGFGGFEEFIRSRGGIVSRDELLDAGWTADELRIAYSFYRRPQRLRRGWYCSSDVPPEVRTAWAHGGPLACLSALRWHGILTHAAQGGDTLHVCVPRHAKRRRIEAHPARPTIVHWHDSALLREYRWAVPLDVAIQQARRCHHAAT
jgi:hypothetical protein